MKATKKAPPPSEAHPRGGRPSQLVKTRWPEQIGAHTGFDLKNVGERYGSGGANATCARKKPVAAREALGLAGCVLVTGASAGLGSELARAFASRNYDLVLLARRREKLDELARELTAEHHVRTRVLTADLSLPETPRRVFEALRKANVRIDILVNNAGIICEGDFLALPLDDQIRLLQTNVVALRR